MDRISWKSVRVVIISTLFLSQLSCKEAMITDLSKKSIIPVPQSIEPGYTAFELRNNCHILVPDIEEVSLIGNYLADEIQTITGMNAMVISSGKRSRGRSISLHLTDSNSDIPAEGYELNIKEKEVNLEATDAAGLFHGVQTIRQILMLNSGIFFESTGKWILPTGVIRDYPVYAFRSSMLDVSRHFFGVEDVKRYIDLMAFYKLNMLHLVLSNDQGWRIEIRSWPKLTEIGGSTEVGGGKGGYYTQDDYRAIIDYAASKYITIIPEIDMPGHTNAALASYAELNCDGKARELYTGTDVGFSTLCTNKEITYKFVEEVIGEIAALTSGPYFHIGGDESHVTPLKDYIPFIEKVQEIVNSNGKLMIGWDEISHSELNTTSLAQYWASSENAKKAVGQGARIIMSPAARCYLDMQYDSTTPLGLHWAGYTDVRSAYEWDPADLVEGIGISDILGIESPLWTETITSIDDIEYMAFPRLIGHAEIGWSKPEQRNWDNYKQRLAHHGVLLDALDVNYYRSPLIHWLEREPGD